MNRLVEGRHYEVDATSGCWNWLRATSVGYGRVKFAGRLDVAHRVSYLLNVGPIPAGQHLDHLCRNPRCVNPAHLEPVTPAENNRRGMGWAGVNARKTECVRGHDLALARITPAGRRQCRECERIRDRARRASRSAALIDADIQGAWEHDERRAS